MKLKIILLISFINIIAITVNGEQRQSPVLVELFTSQGCSSCPPADKVLSEWGRENFEAGEIVPLAFHVDYWDNTGWQDPFDDKYFTERQKRYAKVFQSETIYTPQMVMGGKTQFNGSDLRQAKEQLLALQKTVPAAELKVSTSVNGTSLRVAVTATSIDPAKGQKKILEGYVAVFENELVSDVTQGENWGKELRNDFVVRRFKSLGFLALSSREPSQWSADIFIDPAWKRKNLGVAVFVQDPESMAVDAAQALSPL